MTNYLIVLEFINEFIPNSDVSLVIPLSFDLKVSMRLSVLIFIGQWVLFMSLTMLRDHCKSSSFRSKQKNSCKIMQPQMPVNIDVKDHEQDVLANSKAQNWPIIAHEIEKTYSNGLKAVCGNTFGVKQGQILGLLGPNGAGKSSTFSMLALE